MKLETQKMKHERQNFHTLSNNHLVFQSNSCPIRKLNRRRSTEASWTRTTGSSSTTSTGPSTTMRVGCRQCLAPITQIIVRSGSEHTIGGLRYPAELHLVHQGVQDPCKLAVLGIFLKLEEDGQENGQKRKTIFDDQEMEALKKVDNKLLIKYKK
jgi:hypothetical protein